VLTALFAFLGILASLTLISTVVVVGSAISKILVGAGMLGAAASSIVVFSGAVGWLGQKWKARRASMSHL
jgi:hypothetical protein